MWGWIYEYYDCIWDSKYYVVAWNVSESKGSIFAESAPSFLDHCRNSGTAPVKCSGGFFYPSWSGDKRFFFDCKSVICYRIYFHYIDGAFGGGQPRRNEEYAERRFGDRPDLVSVIYADTADFCNTVPFIRKEFSFWADLQYVDSLRILYGTGAVGNLWINYRKLWMERCGNGGAYLFFHRFFCGLSRRYSRCKEGDQTRTGKAQR